MKPGRRVFRPGELAYAIRFVTDLCADTINYNPLVSTTLSCSFPGFRPDHGDYSHLGAGRAPA